MGVSGFINGINSCLHVAHNCDRGDLIAFKLKFCLQKWKICTKFISSKNFYCRIIFLTNCSLDSRLWSVMENSTSGNVVLMLLSPGSFSRARLQQASASMLKQLCHDASYTVLIENNGIQIGVETHFRTTPLFSIRTISLASSQSCRRRLVWMGPKENCT